MMFLPIVGRELRIRARQKSTHRFRLGGALIAILFVIFMMFIGHGSASPQSIGQPTFTTLAWLAFGYCLLDGVRNTADCLSAEKRSGTLGLLFLTDLKGYDVVLGKLMATSLNSFYALLAIFPPLAIPILVGGVTGGEFWRLVLMLIDTLLFSLCAGMFVSSISREERRALGGTVGLIALITVVPILFRLASWASISWLEAASPGVGFVSVFDAAYSANPGRYEASLLLVHLWSWAFLIAASMLLPRVWQEESAPLKRRSRSLENWLPTLAQSSFSRGRIPGLTGYMNPVTWLALTREGPPTFVWLLVGVVACGGLVSWVFGEGAIGVVLPGVLVVHIAFTARLATQACQCFAEARDSGALELLLCTPLTAAEIVEGHRQALLRMFAKPAVALVIVEFVVIAGGISIELDPSAFVMIPITAWALAILLSDYYAAGEYGLWLGLVSKSSTQALTKTLLYIIVLPALACCVWVILAPVKNLILINYARDQFRRRFRSIAAGRFGGMLREIEAPRPVAPKRPHDLPRVLPE